MILKLNHLTFAEHNCGPSVGQIFPYIQNNCDSYKCVLTFASKSFQSNPATKNNVMNCSYIERAFQEYVTYTTLFLININIIISLFALSCITSFFFMS